jgi:hypothetical protein
MNEGKERRWLILPTSIQLWLAPRFQLAHFRGQKCWRHLCHHVKNTTTAWSTPILSFKFKDSVTFIIKPWRQIRKWKQSFILDTVHWSLSYFNCFTPKETVISLSERVLNRNIPNNPTRSQMAAIQPTASLLLCEISGSLNGKYKDDSLLGYSTVQRCWSRLTLQRCVPSSSSGCPNDKAHTVYFNKTTWRYILEGCYLQLFCWLTDWLSCLNFIPRFSCTSQLIPPICTIFPPSRYTCYSHTHR